MKSNRPESSSADELQNLYTKIAKLITSTLEINEVTEAIMEQVHLYFQPLNWSLLRIDPITQELFFAVAKGIDANEIKQVRLKIGEGIAGHVAQTGKSQYVKNAATDPFFSPIVDKLSGFKTHSVIAVPIIFREQVLGVIEIINTPDSYEFTDNELKTLQTIADFSAIALTNAMRYDRALSLATSDTLTGLYNRTRLDKLIKMCEQAPVISEYRRIADVPCIIVIGIDVDNLKDVNDKDGHHVGDQLLIKTAQLLQSYCRGEDLAFRVGGDEFLLIIQNITEKDMPDVIARFQEKIKSDSKDISSQFSFSFGIVGGMKHRLLELIVAADTEMYKSKALKKKRK